MRPLRSAGGSDKADLDAAGRWHTYLTYDLSHGCITTSHVPPGFNDLYHHNNKSLTDIPHRSMRHPHGERCHITHIKLMFNTSCNIGIVWRTQYCVSYVGSGYSMC